MSNFKEILHMRIVILLSTLFTVFQAGAQSFGLKSSVWHYTNNGGTAPENTWLWTVDFKNDTMLSGENGRHFVTRGNADYGLLPEYYFQLSGDSVMAYNAGQWHLLYNFAASAGDTLKIIDMYTATIQYMTFLVDSVVPVQISGTVLDRFYLHTVDSSQGKFQDGYYTERIGASGFYPYRGSTIPEYAVIRCYSDTDMTLQINYSGPCDAGNPYSVQEVNEAPLIIQPNPTSGFIEVNFPHPVEGLMEVLDASGRFLHSQEFSTKKTLSVMLPNELTDGLYMIKFSYGSTVQSSMVLLKR